MSKFLKCFFLLFCLFFAFNSSAARWKQVYENDYNGKALSGSKTALIKAIRKGKEVRLRLQYDGYPNQEYFTPAENIWVRGDEVTIQNMTQVSVHPDLSFQSDAYRWVIMVNTNGLMLMTRWLLGEHTNKGTNSQRAHVTWYVK